MTLWMPITLETCRLQSSRHDAKLKHHRPPQDRIHDDSKRISAKNESSAIGTDWQRSVLMTSMEHELLMPV